MTKLDCTTCSSVIDTTVSSYYDYKPKLVISENTVDKLRNITMYFCSEKCLAETKYEIDNIKENIAGS